MSKNRLTNPLRLSQPAGAALAFSGIKGCVPLWHGVQGCTAFAKILFISHFREPMPFQTTGLGQANVVMGGDDNVFEALDNLKDSAQMVGILTTGVAETSGVDLEGLVKQAKTAHPGWPICGVSTPDFEGSLETGWVKACASMLDQWVGAKTKTNGQEIGFFVSPYLTPGEVEELRRIAEDLSLVPRIFPDLGDAMMGYLPEPGALGKTGGGIGLKEIEGLSNLGTLVSVGRSMEETTAVFGKKHQIPTFHFDNLTEIGQIDELFRLMLGLSGQPMPRRYAKERQFLQDTLLDVETYFYGRKVGLLGDPDLIHRFLSPLEAMGIDTFAVSSLGTSEYPEGDLESVLALLPLEKPDLLLGNSHVAELAHEEGLGAIRAGYPVEDRIGGQTWVRLGYKGAAWFYMELANAFIAHPKGVAPYVSPLQATLI
ncbi:MAG: nitrogenase iron-molybdenum cofactor biosynthesis protein NifN [Candidatus Lambdaproteobacteria bacterium RIFOXYD1_FULL_56_27]|uniref:Nitrogenase iron-molybdenum cofactor biosynthesis protein NifN n=1 Tax=Candidatus Lambdaproteobacteria bacterium RIFOXYD2_FULL_56_26 TaxID=1817773 RepID=A0A1F6H1U1_9PROT|nr:MAG: nitrogenase iron-molybdenum cofactor biosynthesis protein NifN [Candidatus Lambdaproteobacteria bacterium RIFOXYC1_FULL_56_13]OGH04367.1 MAG: nitrogenase iron-molybdenum cofactor biosynthesis protein NifN [Candidatus Lambdaproteobacteria bacterium RIFOXYD2_FULL_56_26]OGH08658.1 MAG: nitrogenase iron-molybdenum cofactor biosynthesis protein NifN [Candidatus Lambdaproteobacteria bacterium RIFOXYD1_FULL_56_27]